MDNDSDGELSTGDTDVTVYDWDVRNRLVCVTDYALEGGTATQIVTYLYDAENHWIGENLDTNGDGVVDHETRFAYDGDQIIAQFDKEGTGTVAASDLSHRYVANLAAVDQVLADEQVSSGDVLFTLADQLGTVRDLVKVNSSGTSEVVNHRTYDAYGNLKSQSNAAVDCIFGFTGKALDEATGLQNNLNRWYDAKVGAWISKDPIGFTAGDTNTYRYVGNSPTNATDPTGLSGPGDLYTPGELHKADVAAARAYLLENPHRIVYHPWEYPFVGGVDWREARWGCGGVASTFVYGKNGYQPTGTEAREGAGLGSFNPFGWLCRTDVMVYSSLIDAQSQLKKLGGNALIVAVQQKIYNPFRNYATRTPINSINPNSPLRASDVYVENPGGGNFCVLTGNSTNAWWVYANHGWSNAFGSKDGLDSARIYKDKKVSHGERLAYTLFYVIPNAATKSPILAGDYSPAGDLP